MADWYSRFKQTDAFDALVEHVEGLPYSDERIQQDLVKDVLKGSDWSSFQRAGRRLEREWTSVPYVYRTTVQSVPIRIRVEGRFYEGTFRFGFATVGVGRWTGPHEEYTVFSAGNDSVSKDWVQKST